MNGIDKITEKILAEAKAAERAALEKAAERADEILQAGEEEAELIRERIEDRAAREGEAIVTRAKSTAAMVRRNADLAVRGALIDEVFEKAFAEIAALPVEEYRALLCKMVCEAMLEQQRTAAESRALHGDEVETVEAYERTLGDALLRDVRDALRGKVDAAVLERLVLSDTPARISGGVLLRYGDVETNCSFEAVFAQARAVREAEVSRILFA